MQCGMTSMLALLLVDRVNYVITDHLSKKDYKDTAGVFVFPHGVVLAVDELAHAQEMADNVVRFLKTTAQLPTPARCRGITSDWWRGWLPRPWGCRWLP